MSFAVDLRRGDLCRAFQLQQRRCVGNELLKRQRRYLPVADSTHASPALQVQHSPYWQAFQACTALSRVLPQAGVTW